MATLQKFKLLATQCAVAGSPTRSPSASPVIHLRRRRTLRMLLSRPDRDRHRHRRGAESPDLSDRGGEADPPERVAAAVAKEARAARRKLRDLFVSSPPMEDRVSEKRREDNRGDGGEGEEEAERGFLPAAGSVTGGFSVGLATAARRRGAGSLRPVAAVAGFRYRFLRRAWRPVLVSIPE